MIDSKKIGKLIAHEREKSGLTQEQLASKLYVTRQAISRWERGVGIPDYELLSKLCEVFKITPNEIMAGERKKEKNSKYVDNILIDILKDNTKKIKRIIIFSSLIIFSLIISFLIYYFISTYNQFRIYKISGNNENFEMLETLAVFSNENAYIKFGGVKSLNYEIENIEYYYIKENEKKKIYSSEKGEALLIQNKGYNEYFDFKDINLIIKNMMLEISYKENGSLKTSTIDLKCERVYANSKLLFNEEDKISNNNSNKNGIADDDPLSKIKKNFTLNENNEYVLNYTDKNNKKVNIVYNQELNSFIVSEQNKNSIEEFYYWGEENYEYHFNNKSNELAESLYTNGNIVCNSGDCKNHKNKYDYYKKNYVDVYLK